MSMSNNLLAASALVVALVFTTTPQVADAAQTSKAANATAAPVKQRTPQQQRMADCNHKAKLEGKKGAERKAFMSSCLKGKQASSTADAKPQPKAKMKSPATEQE